MDAAAELGRNTVNKHQIQPEYENEQADTGRDCRTRLGRPNFSGANADREIFNFPCSTDHKQDRQAYPVDPYSCLNINLAYEVHSSAQEYSTVGIRFLTRLRFGHCRQSAGST